MPLIQLEWFEIVMKSLKKKFSWQVVMKKMLRNTSVVETLTTVASFLKDN